MITHKWKEKNQMLSVDSLLLINLIQDVCYRVNITIVNN